MPTPAAKKALSLDDFAGLFAGLAERGVESIVIGGCAVGAYARVRGQNVLSGDLDLLATWPGLEVIVSAIAALGGKVLKMPRPRTVPVAVVEWEGKEVNVLTSSDGLPPAELEARVAREFFLRGLPDLPVLVADPYDLLRNKLRINRPKDRPHIAILRGFLDEEIVDAFTSESDPRKRIGPATRLLAATEEAMIDELLGVRLVPLARTPADFRVLAHRLPTAALGAAVIARSPNAKLADELRAIVRGRHFRGRKRAR